MNFNHDILNYEWALFIDIDEFFVFNAEIFASLFDFLDWHNLRETDAIGINWVWVGSNGLFTWEDRPLTSRFRYRLKNQDTHIKSLFRPRKIMAAQCHFAIPIEGSHIVYREANAEMHTNATMQNIPANIRQAHSDFPNMDYAFILHYAHKSYEEFIWKFSRNRGDRAIVNGISFSGLEERFFKVFLERFNKKDVDALPAINAACPNFLEKIIIFKKIKGIDDAHNEITVQFKERLRLVLHEFEKIPPENFGQHGQAFLALKY